VRDRTGPASAERREHGAGDEQDSRRITIAPAVFSRVALPWRRVSIDLVFVKCHAISPQSSAYALDDVAHEADGRTTFDVREIVEGDPFDPRQDALEPASGPDSSRFGKGRSASCLP
jgi:hypothetical protein